MRRPSLAPPVVETDRMVDTDDWVSSTVQSPARSQATRRRSNVKSLRQQQQQHQYQQTAGRRPSHIDSLHDAARDSSRSLVAPGNRRRSSDFRLAPLSSPPRLPVLRTPPPPQRLTLPAINQEMTRLHLVQSPRPTPDRDSSDEEEEKPPNIDPSESKQRRRNSVQSQDRESLPFNPEEFFPPRAGADDQPESHRRRKRTSLDSNGSQRDQNHMPSARNDPKGNNSKKVKKNKPGNASKGKYRKNMDKTPTNTVNATNNTNINSNKSNDTRNDSIESFAERITSASLAYKDTSSKHQNTIPLGTINLDPINTDDEKEEKIESRSKATAYVARKSPIPPDPQPHTKPKVQILDHDSRLSLKIPEIQTTCEVMDGSGLRHEGEGVEARDHLVSAGGRRRNKIKTEQDGKDVEETEEDRGHRANTSKDGELNDKRKRLVREDAKDIEDGPKIQIRHTGTRDEEALRMPGRKLWGSNGFKGSISINMLHPTVKFYHQVCAKLGILPLRKVLAQFGRSHLSFRDLSFTTKDMKAVCLALQKEEKAGSIDFTGNRIGQKGVDYLIDVLSQLHTVYQVSLCNNWLRGEPTRSLSRFFLMNDFIARLDLSGNRLNDNDAESITQILERNKTIKTLVLNHNEFREEGGVLMGEAIARNTTLEDLDLSWNHLRRCGAIGIARGLQDNVALRTVNLAWNGFGFEGCLAIGDMLSSNHTITELDLACNRINPPALLELLRGLTANKTLRILRIGYNPITAAFSSLILAVIQKHVESGLENIDMAGVVVDKEFVALLEEIQKDRFFIVNYEVSLPVAKISREEMREKIGLPSAYNVDPLRMLYLLKEKMRASDFFYKINKDNDDGLQRDELYSLFDEAGIPVTGSVVDKIFDFMDTNGDGTIDLGEFLQGDKRMKNIARKQVRDEQQRKGKEEKYNKYSRTFQKAHLDPITNALKVDPTIAPMRQSRRPSVAPRDSSDTLDNGHLRIQLH